MQAQRPLYAQQFDDIAPYYDEVMSVVPYRQWVQYLRKLCKRFGWKPRHILDLATGTGSVALQLAEYGYQVVGVDLSPRMIEIACRKAIEAGVADQVEFMQKDAAQLEFSSRFDLAVSLFDSLNYILSAHALRRVFCSVFASLLPGGGFIFDLNSVYCLEHNLFSQDNFWDEEARVKHIWTSTYNKRTRMATVEMEFLLPDGRRFFETHKERAHRHADVIAWLGEAGFEFLDAFDAYTLLPPGKKSERIFYTARKPK